MTVGVIRAARLGRPVPGRPGAAVMNRHRCQMRWQAMGLAAIHDAGSCSSLVTKCSPRQSSEGSGLGACQGGTRRIWSRLIRCPGAARSAAEASRDRPDRLCRLSCMEMTDLAILPGTANDDSPAGGGGSGGITGPMPGAVVESPEGDHRSVAAASTILPDGPCDPRVVPVEPPALGATTGIRLRGGQMVPLPGRLAAAPFPPPEGPARAAGLPDRSPIRTGAGTAAAFPRIESDRPGAILCSAIPVIAHGPDAGAPAAHG